MIGTQFVKGTPIDVWDLSTFDNALMDALNSESDLLLNFALTETKNFLAYSNADRWEPLASNQFAADRNRFVEHVVMPAMEQRTIRAWHYTRLTDAETEKVRSEGVLISSLEHIRRRLTALVKARTISAETADALFGKSPFHKQLKARSGKFWMVSHPLPADHGNVEDLLCHWGGEGVYFWLESEELEEQVMRIGHARVIEVAVPMSTTCHTLHAASAIVGIFVRSLGCQADAAAFDLYSKSNLSQGAVLNLHTEGDSYFAALGRGYPNNFIKRE